MQQQVCGDEFCGWKGEPFIPDKKPIRTVKSIPVQGCWYYEMFDQYGQTCTVSRGYDSEGEATTVAKDDIMRSSKLPGYGKCTAVVWPPTTKVQGKRVDL
jgi:hypothetical protein